MKYIEKACFKYETENNGFISEMFISHNKKSFFIIIKNNSNTYTRIKKKKYKTNRKAYKKFLYQIGESIRAGWPLVEWTLNDQIIYPKIVKDKNEQQ
jgi:hypothetical protein